MSTTADRTYAIHPALGIARIGNAAADPADATTYYLGAEAPSQVPNQGLPYKVGGKIKKQAQRFRIYEFEAGRATREITLVESDIAAIEWTVHLANRKAALETGQPLGSPSLPAVVPPVPFGLDATPDGDPHYWPATSRNTDVPAAQRGALCIDAGPRSVGGPEDVASLAGTITFFPGGQAISKAVTLGTLRVEQGTGRLLVFGGDGLSEGLLDGQFSSLAAVPDWGNNGQWYDDTADGWVQAKITFVDGSTVTLDQPGQRAWVLCAAPRFSPWMNWISTLHDVAVNAVRLPTDEVPRPSFAADVYPLLRCAALMPWVSARASAGHSTPAGNYLLADRMRLMSDNNPSPASDAYKARAGVFARVRNPNVGVDRTTVQKYMPQVSRDIQNNTASDYDIAVLTPLQYALLGKWRDGDFDADGTPTYVPLEGMDVASQPAALDRATLEGTAGTPFYPGIESWRILRKRDLYADGCALRMSAATQPGDLTMGNALPWQADFLDCNDIWWPVQRPNEVTRAGQPMQEWVPDAWVPGNDSGQDYGKLVEAWSSLGFVVTQDGGATYEEVERDADGGDA